MLAAELAVAATGGGSETPGEALSPPHLVEEVVAAGIAHDDQGYFTLLVGVVAAFDCDSGGPKIPARYRRSSLRT